LLATNTVFPSDDVQVLVLFFQVLKRRRCRPASATLSSNKGRAPTVHTL